MPRSLTRLSPALALVLAIPASLSAQERVVGDRADGQRIVSVSGLGEQTVTPDIAELEVGVQSRGQTAAECLATNGREATDLMNGLKEEGVGPEDIKTSGFNLRPVYEKPRAESSSVEPAAKVVGYTAEHKITITVRDTKKVGRLLDMLVKAGVNDVSAVEFSVSNLKSVLRELRKQALADSLEKADEAAGALGMVRGLPVSVEIHDIQTGPQYSFAARSNKGSDPNAPHAIPIAVGQEVVSVAATVVYEIKLPSR